jgi:hypothetical protein
MIARTPIVLMTLIFASSPLLAQSITLTEGRGRPITIGYSTQLAEGLVPTSIAPQALVSEFKRLCLPDPSGAPSRIEASPLMLQASEVVLPQDGKRSEMRVPRWRGQSAELTIWMNDDTNLKGRPIKIDERAYQVTGSYGPFNAKGEQCNLVVAVASFANAVQVSEALATTFGQLGKLVVKNTFADGHWQMDTTSINFTAPTTRNGPQPIHLSVKVMQKGAK